MFLYKDKLTEKTAHFRLASASHERCFSDDNGNGNEKVVVKSKFSLL